MRSPCLDEQGVSYYNTKDDDKNNRRYIHTPTQSRKTHSHTERTSARVHTAMSKLKMQELSLYSHIITSTIHPQERTEK